MSCDLSPSLRFSEIVAKAHKRRLGALVHAAFVRGNVNTLLCLFDLRKAALGV